MTADKESIFTNDTQALSTGPHVRMLLMKRFYYLRKSLRFLPGKNAVAECMSEQFLCRENLWCFLDRSTVIWCPRRERILLMKFWMETLCVMAVNIALTIWLVRNIFVEPKELNRWYSAGGRNCVNVRDLAWSCWQPHTMTLWYNAQYLLLSSVYYSKITLCTHKIDCIQI